MSTLGLNYINKSSKMIRHTDAFRSTLERKRYRVALGVLLALAALLSLALIFYNNPVTVDSPSFRPIVLRRIKSIVAMLIAALCQSFATLAFQSISNNKIITPSLLGYEALYTTIQTGTMFFFGISAFQEFQGGPAFAVQFLLMIGLSVLLYGTLLTGKHGDLQTLLIVGIIIGTGLRSLSGFMRRLLSPASFDILQARLFASVNHADSAYFPIAIPLVLVAVFLFMLTAKRLNILSLGPKVSEALGLSYRKHIIFSLVLVAILIAVSTALVGPMTFFGFLVVSLTYQLAPTYDHKYLFPFASLLGFVVLAGAYFLMQEVFKAQGVVMIVIEFIGGLSFLLILWKRGIE